METTTLTPEMLCQINACWRAANYLSVGQIYLSDNPLLKRRLKLADIKPLIVGHCFPATTARYFNHAEVAGARHWLTGT